VLLELRPTWARLMGYVPGECPVMVEGAVLGVAQGRQAVPVADLAADLAGTLAAALVLRLSSVLPDGVVLQMPCSLVLAQHCVLVFPWFYSPALLRRSRNTMIEASLMPRPVRIEVCRLQWLQLRCGH